MQPGPLSELSERRDSQASELLGVVDNDADGYEAGPEMITQESICNVALAGDDHVVLGLVGGSKMKVRGSLHSCHPPETEATGDHPPDVSEKFYLVLDNGRRLTIDKSHIAADDMKVIEGMSTPGLDPRTSHIQMRTILDKSKDLEKAKVQKKRLTLMVVALVVLCVVLCAGMFATTVAATELTKEILVRDGVLEDRIGDKVKVSSADFSVTQNGALVKATENANSTAEAAAIATMPMKIENVLSSSLPDEFFEALAEVTVHSNKGHYLTVKVHGFARIPVLNSRCGNIVHLFSAWGHRMTLDSTDLSFDPDLSAIFENAGFELAVGGVGGRRLSAAAAIAGFYNHITNIDGAGSWTCADVPLPRVANTYLQRFTLYKACSGSQSDGSHTTVGFCDSKYGGYLPGVDKLPIEHQLAVLDRIDQIKLKLGHSVDDAEIRYSQKEVTVMKSPSYQVQVERWASHPLMEKVSILNFMDMEGVAFQRKLIGHTGNRLYCKDMENITDDPSYKAITAAKEGVNVTVHFEFVGLEMINQVVYRHFRMMPADEFRDWMGTNNTEPDASVHHFWDNADTLVPFRMLLPEGSLVVFHEATHKMTDAEVQNLANFTSSISLTLPCHYSEKDGFAEDQLERVPNMRAGMTDLNIVDIDYYALALADTAVEEDPHQTGGYPSLAKLTSASAYYSFAQYALQSKEFLAMADACLEGCSKQVAKVDEWIQEQKYGEETLCACPFLQGVMTCWEKLAGLDGRTSEVCLRSPFFDKVKSCFALDWNETNATNESLTSSGRRLRVGLNAEYLPDGTKKLDLSRLSPRMRAEISRETGFEVIADNAWLLFNATGSDIDSPVVETISSTGVVTTRQLLGGIPGDAGAPGTGTSEWGTCDNLGRICISRQLPTGCGKEGPESVVFSFDPFEDAVWTARPVCTYYFMISIYRTGGWSGRFALEGGGQINLLKAYPVVPSPPFLGSVYAGGGIGVSPTQVCKTIPFSLTGSFDFGFKAGIDLYICQIDLLSFGGTFGVGTAPRINTESSLEVHIGSSSSNEKCIDKDMTNMWCAPNAGHQGVRTNTDYANAGDTFSFQIDTAQVCAKRTDSSGGWGMDLKIGCIADLKPVHIGPSSENTKCINGTMALMCEADAGDKDKRTNTDLTPPSPHLNNCMRKWVKDPCVTTVVGWTDGYSDTCCTCEDWGKYDWCTITGEKGSNWDSSAWGEIEDWANPDGVNPKQACCECGGGQDQVGIKHPCAECVESKDTWCASNTWDSYCEGACCGPTYYNTEGCEAECAGGSACSESFQFFRVKNTAKTTASFSVSRIKFYSDTAATNEIALPSGGTSFHDCPHDFVHGSSELPEYGVDASCVDEPAQVCTNVGGFALCHGGWESSTGRTCSEYVAWDWCTSSGGYGSGWNDDWFDFHHWENIEGISANEACCGCGGGSHGCSDTPKGWVDAGGDGCSIYKLHDWCTSSGGLGPGWLSGDFAVQGGDFDSWEDDDGVAADEACCVCGGGSQSCVTQSDVETCCDGFQGVWTHCQYDKGSYDCTLGSAAIEQTGCTGTLTTYTVTGATGNHGVTMDGHIIKYTVDGGEVTGTRSQKCESSISDWKDSDGDTCEVYESNQYCTSYGGHGTGWKGGISGVFADYKVSDVAADQACCECGGGDWSQLIEFDDSESTAYKMHILLDAVDHPQASECKIIYSGFYDPAYHPDTYSDTWEAHGPHNAFSDNSNSWTTGCNECDAGDAYIGYNFGMAAHFQSYGQDLKVQAVKVEGDMADKGGLTLEGSHDGVHWQYLGETTGPTGGGCVDTPDWGNGHNCVNEVGEIPGRCTSAGWTCSEYDGRWCANRAAMPGWEWALGASWNFPEDNCCVCGKGGTGSNIVAIAPEANTYDDTFSITTSSDEGGKVCATRTDASSGWDLDLKITCIGHSKTVRIGASLTTNTRCVTDQGNLHCNVDAGNNMENFDASIWASVWGTEYDFAITTSTDAGGTVCATRTGGSGWGHDLTFQCTSLDGSSDSAHSDCDIKIFGDFFATVGPVRGTLASTYYVLSAVFQMQLKLEVFMGVPGIYGWWQEEVSVSLIDTSNR